MEQLFNANARAILEVVRDARDHPTVLEVYQRVRRARPRIGLATVYRVLHQLVEHGLVKELGHGADGSRFDANTQRHDHAICTICGALLDVPLDVDVSDEALQAAARSSGLEFGTYEVRLYGRCASCRDKEKAKI